MASATARLWAPAAPPPVAAALPQRAESSPPPPPPDLRQLAAGWGVGGMAPLTPAQVAEERKVRAEQVALARQALASGDVAGRVEGAEQLGAYPTAESGQALIITLGKDASPTVRVAAAASLANFPQPGATVIRGLLSALRDTSADVREAALGTLEIYLAGRDGGSAESRQIMAGLAKLARSRQIDPALRSSLRDLLANR